MTEHPDISPKYKAALKMQLSAANARLLSLERQRRRLMEEIASLTASLQRIEGPAGATVSESN